MSFRTPFSSARLLSDRSAFLGALLISTATFFASPAFAQDDASTWLDDPNVGEPPRAQPKPAPAQQKREPKPAPAATDEPEDPTEKPKDDDDDDEKKEEEYREPVAIRLVLAEPGYTVSLDSNDATQEPAVCKLKQCFFVLEQGRYRVELFRDGESLGYKDVKLNQPQKLTVSPPRPALARTGLVMAIVGSPVFVAGVFVTFISVFGGTRNEDERNAKIGLAMALGGGALAGVGWPMFFVLRKPSVHDESIVKKRNRHGSVESEGGYAVSQADDAGGAPMDGSGAPVGAGVGWAFRF